MNLETTIHQLLQQETKKKMNKPNLKVFYNKNGKCTAYYKAFENTIYIAHNIDENKIERALTHEYLHYIFEKLFALIHQKITSIEDKMLKIMEIKKLKEQIELINAGFDKYADLIIYLWIQYPALDDQEIKEIIEKQKQLQPHNFQDT